MKRPLSTLIAKDLEEKIVLLSGPRQVGKTTLSKTLFQNFDYLNFDSEKNRRIILAEEWDRSKELIIFDELHKLKKWKSWIKGVFDTEGVKPKLLVTGSARLDVYRKGGDSLAGRYFPYRLHPFTVKELKGQMEPKACLEHILKFGGFPEPFLKGSEQAANRWRRTHLNTIIREDLIDLEKVRDVKSIEILIGLLRQRVASSTSYTSLANDLQVSIHTVKHWLQILENLYIIFPIYPYHHNIARSLLKEPKYYFYDTGSVIGSDGQRFENAVACALLSELHYIEDTSGKKVSLHYLRDKEKREIDFLTVVDGEPTQMIEAKWADEGISKNFYHFLKYLKPIPSFQVVFECKRRRSSPEVSLVKAEDYLLELNLV